MKSAQRQFQTRNREIPCDQPWAQWNEKCPTAVSRPVTIDRSLGPAAVGAVERQVPNSSFKTCRLRGRAWAQRQFQAPYNR